MMTKSKIWNHCLPALLLFGYIAESAAATTGESPVTSNAIALQNQTWNVANDLTDEELSAQLNNIQGQVALNFNPIVRNHILMYVNRKRDVSQMILGRSKLYMPIFERYLAQYNMPSELKYLAVIESALNPFAVSPAGAGGLWQFMPGTGPMWGLKIDRTVDERFDPEKSTEAACKFLSFLYARYGNWQLAIAAYNCGPGRVDSAIAQAGGIYDYWTIYDYLPAETRNYVPAFIAATYMMNYYSQHGIEPALMDTKLTNTEGITVTNGTTFHQICAISGVSPAVVTYLNPSFRRGVVPANANGYKIVLPVENYVAFSNYLNGNPTMPVLEGNDGSGIAMNIAPPLEAAPVLENVSENVPLNASPRLARAARETKKTREISHLHRIKKGDSLYSIAQKYGTTVEDIRQLNGIKKGSKGDLDPGETIVVKKGKK